MAYAHPINDNCSFYLDCYDHKGRCMASYANSPHECRTVYSSFAATPNCYVSINEQRGTIMLKCLVDHIPPHTELTWVYENSYPYPPLHVL